MNYKLSLILPISLVVGLALLFRLTRCLCNVGGRIWGGGCVMASLAYFYRIFLGVPHLPPREIQDTPLVVRAVRMVPGVIQCTHANPRYSIQHRLSIVNVHILQLLMGLKHRFIV